MLKSYEAIYTHGRIHWLGEAPPLDQARIIVTVLDEITAPLPASHRVPPPALKGPITCHDYNPCGPTMTDEEAGAALDRTAWQIAGDADAFRI